MDVEPWYSVHGIFRHRAAHVDPSTYEERIILLRAHDFDDAIRRAEEEARGYTGSLEGVEYLECLDSYHLFEDVVGEGTEVFSLMRNSELGPREKLSRSDAKTTPNPLSGPEGASHNGAGPLFLTSIERCDS